MFFFPELPPEPPIVQTVEPQIAQVGERSGRIPRDIGSLMASIIAGCNGPAPADLADIARRILEAAGPGDVVLTWNPPPAMHEMERFERATQSMNRLGLTGASIWFVGCPLLGDRITLGIQQNLEYEAYDNPNQLPFWVERVEGNQRYERIRKVPVPPASYFEGF